jgi:hypothetical protein
MTVEEETVFLDALKQMEADTRYNTPTKYSPDTRQYPTNEISFSSLHLTYLRKYPDVDPEQYLQNLRLITLVL